jgi:hypothetical protein
MLGEEGLKAATEIAILNANYLAEACILIFRSCTGETKDEWLMRSLWTAGPLSIPVSRKPILPND